MVRLCKEVEFIGGVYHKEGKLEIFGYKLTIKWPLNRVESCSGLGGLIWKIELLLNDGMEDVVNK